MADYNGTSGLSSLIQSLTIEQNVDRTCLYLFHFQSNKGICNAKRFRKSNRQYLNNQQKLSSLPDSPCQTVLKFCEIRQFFLCFLFAPVISHETKRVLLVCLISFKSPVLAKQFCWSQIYWGNEDKGGVPIIKMEIWNRFCKRERNEDEEKD